MMEKCFEIGVIQAFLDGELGAQLSEKVARHIAVCDACAIALAEAEEETAFAFSALEQEFDALVPTQRLWTKINDSIEQKRSKSVSRTVFANFQLLFANPSIAAFASLLIIAGIFAVVWSSGFKRNENNNENNIARNNAGSKQKIILPNRAAESPVLPDEKNAEKPRFIEAENPSFVKEASNYRVEKADFVKTDYKKENVRNSVNRNKPAEIAAPPKAVSAEYLAGEESYIKTIATLEKTVDSRKDEVLKPSARFSFEKDLAVVNDAIDKMKTQVRENPKNEAAKQVLLSSYQNKIDLLNTVAEKNDLMASLR